jgi:hypothetical protein
VPWVVLLADHLQRWADELDDHVRRLDGWNDAWRMA